MTPTVAIIVRTKNRPQFLTRALANIAEQTYQDYAVYVVNDGGDRAEAERSVAASPVADKSTPTASAWKPPPTWGFVKANQPT